MNKFTLNKLPFYWRLSEKKNNIVSDFHTFSFAFDEKNNLLLQKRNKKILDDLKKIYKENENIGYIQEDNKLATPYADDFFSYLENFLSKNQINSILEIGCGGCLILNKLKKKYNVTGIDSSKFSEHYSNKYQINFVRDFYPSNKLKNKKYDLIYHIDVLEHINDYEAFLKNNYQNLNNNSFLIVNVPDASESLIIGDISIAMHQHLNYFTNNSLVNTLENNGFKVIDIQKSMYGGSLYVTAIKNNSNNIVTTNSIKKFNFEEYIERAQTNKQKIELLIEKIIINYGTVGIYVPLRALPYIYSEYLEKYESKIRFFDDTPNWYGKFFDGSNIKIENFEDLKNNPEKNIIIFSLTFHKQIKTKIKKNIKMINVYCLADLID